MKILLKLFFLVVLFSSQVQAQCLQIYMVRHAEKSDNDPKDPDLSSQGLERVSRLNTFFKHINFDLVFATPYKRTQQTANGIKNNSQELIIYNPSHHAEIFSKVDEFSAKNILVVGHSNTIPVLGKILLEEEVPTIEEEDFGQIWQVNYCPKQKEMNSLSIFHLP